MKTIAWLIVVNIPLSILSWLVLSASGSDFSVGFRSTLISTLPNYILYAVSFFALVMVFQYGAELQRLSDETL